MRSNKDASSRTQIGKEAVSPTRLFHSSSSQLHPEFECTSSLSAPPAATATDRCSCCRDPYRFHRLKFLRRIPRSQDSSYVTVRCETDWTCREYSWECGLVMRVTPSNLPRILYGFAYEWTVVHPHVSTKLGTEPFSKISTFEKSDSKDSIRMFSQFIKNSPQKKNFWLKMNG